MEQELNKNWTDATSKNWTDTTRKLSNSEPNIWIEIGENDPSINQNQIPKRSKIDQANWPVKNIQSAPISDDVAQINQFSTRLQYLVVSTILEEEEEGGGEGRGRGVAWEDEGWTYVYLRL